MEIDVKDMKEITTQLFELPAFLSSIAFSKIDK